MKRKLKNILAMLLAVMLIFSATPATASAAGRKPTPGKVTLTQISSPAYNKINIKWNRTSNATHYKIYYKKAGAGQWTSLATVSGSATSYTHTSSKSRPVTPGQKYTYTVRGYNSRYKTYGSYDSRGLTTYTKPATVKLNRASLGADKKSVTVSWNRAAGCNYYCVFRKTPSTGWKRLANVRDPYTVYTDRNPVKGQTNIYTVRGYYSPTKTYGNYNTRGLSVNVPKTGTPDKPQKITPGPVTLSKISAPAYNKINIQWKKASNATHYKIYYKKYGAASWTNLATVSGNTSSYTHTSSSTKPIIVGQKYTYTVKAYNNRYNTNGRYNSKGLTASTKLSTVKLRGASLSGDKRSVKVSWNPVPGCNQYFVYRKTPSTGWARIATLKSNVTSYTDQRPVSNNTNTYTVRAQGGYITRRYPQKTGTYNVQVREIKPQFLDNPLYADSSLNCCYETTASVRVTLKDYKKSGVNWINGLIKKYTKPGMTPKEQFEAVIYGEFVNGSRYRYPTTIRGEEGYATMLKEQGAFWQNHQLNSFTSPNLMYDIGQIIGYPVEIVSYDVSNPDHDCVRGPDGKLYSICPMVSTGQIDKEDIEYIDFSKY